MSGLRIGLPSKGSLHDPTIRFLEGCGLAVRRTSNRHYMGEIGGMGDVPVLFLPAAEIPAKVAEGACDIAFTGLDLVRENPTLSRNLVPLFERLGYGGARLVLAVPETWRDVESLADVVELAAQWRAEREVKIRVATKFPSLTRTFLLASGISDHAIVRSYGATELSGWLKDADLISDLTSTGSTLAANRLKEIDGGTILESEACLIGNRGALLSDDDKRQGVRHLLDRIEARLRACVTYVLAAVCDREQWETRSGAPLDEWLVGTAHSGDDVQITLHVPRTQIDASMNALRKRGLLSCRVTEPAFLFEKVEIAHRNLLRRLKHGREEG